ncbi:MULTISPECIES: hypothetical protein [Bradyrhizobium]|uniref:hypothetical protein n=1 Tax=Bradyrhizobium TaxID=374 RepID=UPI0012D32C80|nr:MULTISPECIES: hypothetical protein [Bradyrhizobium]
MTLRHSISGAGQIPKMLDFHAFQIVSAVPSNAATWIADFWSEGLALDTEF